MMTDRTLKGVVLAAGFGTRMAALTTEIPKPLLPIVNIPALEHIIRSFRAAGVQETLLITGYRADVIESYFGDGQTWGMPIQYQRQTEVSGTGSATRLAASFVGDHPFLLTYGDILLDPDEYIAVTDLYHQSKANASSALNKMEDVSIGSAVYLEGNRIVKVIEKPPPGTSGTNLNNAGLFLFQPSIFDAIDKTPISIRGEYELTEAVQTLIADGQDIRGHVIKGQQYDIGTPEAFIETNIRLLNVSAPNGTSEPANTIADNFASANIILENPVTIGPDCQLERCRLGPNVCLGPSVRIGHGVTIQHSVVMAGADIGDGASLSYAIVGRGASVSNRQILHGTSDKVIVVGDGEEVE